MNQADWNPIPFDDVTALDSLFSFLFVNKTRRVGNMRPPTLNGIMWDDDVQRIVGPLRTIIIRPSSHFSALFWFESCPTCCRLQREGPLSYFIFYFFRVRSFIWISFCRRSSFFCFTPRSRFWVNIQLLSSLFIASVFWLFFGIITQ